MDSQVPLVSKVSLASLVRQELPVLLAARVSTVQLDSLVYQEAQATQVSQASVDRLVRKVLREPLDRLVQLAVLDYKDVQETLALLVHTRRISS